MENSQATSITAIVGVVTGVLALITSIINSYLQYIQSKLRLKVVATFRQDYTSGKIVPLIELHNNSKFAVFIDDFGFIENTGIKVPMLVHLAASGSLELPLKIESCNSYSIKLSTTKLYVDDLEFVYAVTATGKIIKSGLKKFKKDCKKYICEGAND